MSAFGNLNMTRVLQRALETEIQFGDWWYVPTYKLLIHDQPFYQIDLDECKTQGEILSWVQHIIPKNWATPQTIGNLILAIDSSIGLRGIAKDKSIEKVHERSAL